MEQPGRKRRRSRRQPTAAMPPMPVWQRAFAVLLFLGGGGAAAIWGTFELAGWVGSLGRGEPLIETDNFVLGLPLIGAGMLLLTPEFMFPRVLARWPEARRTRAGLAVLGTMLVGVLLVFLGQIVINVAMEVDGYRACHVGGRGRVTEVTWARGTVDCPPAEPSR